MSKQPHMLKRGEVWYHRVTVPSDLVGKFGKKNRIVSLETKDKREAKKLARIEDVAADREFDELRNVPPASVKQECETRYREVIEVDFIWRAETRVKAEADPDAFYRGDVIDLPDTQRYYDLTQDGVDLDRMLKYVFKADLRDRLRGAQDNLASGRYDVGENPILALGLVKAEIRAFEALLSRDFPDVEDEQLEPEVVHNGPLFTAAAEKYIAEKRRSGVREKTIETKEAIHRDFIAVTGDKPLSAYRKSDGSAYKEALIKAPTNVKKIKTLKDLDIIEAGKRADEMRDVPRLSITTVNDKLGYVSAFFTWAQKNYDGDVTNPVEGLKISNPVSRRERRGPFKTDDLIKLFNAPVYTGCKNASHWSTPGDLVLRNNSKFWVPLVGLLTGMRLGEIIQLTGDDIREADGVTYIDVNKDEKGKSLKNSDSERRIPVHPELVAIGFIAFVGRRKGRIFADYKQAKDGSWSDAFSKHFARFRKNVGVGETFHGFRHGFEDACRNCDVPADVMDAIQGHAQSGMRGIYGSGHGLKTLDKAMKKIRYDGLDLTHLRP